MFEYKTQPNPSLKIKQIPSSLLFFTNKLNKIVVKIYQGDILLTMSGAEVIFRTLEWKKCK
ncbi:hypothetical protein A9G13_10945 [Gilliamella sp. wkB178]|nr:hypothetical protein A9G13_03915 [Gilliamella apicola]OCG09725.1 hypothetical protein A9G13_10945 [Gilliamella apicola]